MRYYKFLGVKQADGIKTKEVYNRAKEEISRRMNFITRTSKSYKDESHTRRKVQKKENAQ